MGALTLRGAGGGSESALRGGVPLRGATAYPAFVVGSIAQFAAVAGSSRELVTVAGSTSTDGSA